VFDPKYIAETVEVAPGSMFMATPSGRREIRAAFKTIPLPAWIIRTPSCLLSCAFDHLVAVFPDGFAAARDVEPGDLVLTVNGYETVWESMPSCEESAPMYDFQVEGEVYYTSGVASHNSTAFCARQLINSNILPKYRSLYIVPHSDQRDTYANRLAEMSKAFRFPETSKHHRQNLFLREFSNGSVVELIRVLTSADPSRGKTSQELLWDEVQNMDPGLEPEVQQTQKSAELPVTIYAGTSTTIDSMLEGKYMDSSKGTWHVRSPNETDWLNLGDRETVLSMIRPEGLTCPITGRLVDVTDGEFVHEDLYLAEAGLTGLHIPQIIIPEYCNGILKWDEIYQSFIDYSEAKFLQEIIGIPSEEADREISQADLERLCVLKLSDAQIASRIAQGAYKFVVSGCDWGGSDYNPALKTKLSYTVHSVLGVRHDAVMEGLHFKRYSSMDYQSVANDIVENHVRLGGFAIASDFGAGAAYNMLLRSNGKINPARHVIFGYVGPNSAPVATPSGPHMFNQLSLNRTEAISNLYQTIKAPQPRLLFNEWARTGQYLTDFLNLYRVLSDSPQSGATTFTYRRHGSKADDTLHSVNFAYTLARILLGEKLIDDPALNKAIQAQFAGASASVRTRPVGVVSG
jgi:hypothetical protein